MRWNHTLATMILLAVSMLNCPVASSAEQVVFGGRKVQGLSRPTGLQLQLRVPTAGVAGFPMIIRLSAVATKTSYADNLIDLANDNAVPGWFLGFDNAAGDGYKLGYLGSPSDILSRQGPLITAHVGEGITYWFDAAQLGLATWAKRKLQGKECTYFIREPIPVIGKWSVSVDHDALVSLHEQEVEVRKPNPDEKRIIDILQHKGARLSWFPDVVRQGGDIPEDLVRPLPVETRRVVRLIKVLRAAYVSPQDGLDTIYLYSAEDWGYLRALIDLVQYECLRDLDRTKEAETVRARWKDDVSLSVNFRLVDQGMGLIAHFPKDVERRQFVEQLTNGVHRQRR